MIPKTNREVLEFVRRFLLEQGGTASDGGSCRYLTPDRKHKCAIGCLLTAEEYCSEWEGTPVESLEDELPERFSDYNMEMLNSMQTVHDNYDPMVRRAKFRGELKEEWAPYINRKFEELESNYAQDY